MRLWRLCVWIERLFLRAYDENGRRLRKGDRVRFRAWGGGTVINARVDRCGQILVGFYEMGPVCIAPEKLEKEADSE